MHIGIHCFEYPPCNHGGIGSFSKDLAEGLVREGHEVTVFGFYYQNVLKVDNVIIEMINGVKVYRYPEYKKFSNKWLNTLFSRVQLYRNVKALHEKKTFDIIETPENKGWFPFGVPSHIPMVTRLHGGVTYFGIELNRKFSRMVSLLEKFQLQKSKQIVSVSEYTAKKTLDIFQLNKKYSVIYNSVQVPENFSCSEIKVEKALIVFSGSVLPKKGVEELVKAMNIICKHVVEVELVLAGKILYKKEGRAYDEYLLEQVEEKYRNKIHFMGSLHREKELFPLLCKADICVYPSHAEAFSLAPLEAMALGKAVIYSKRHSGKEALIDMESGVLCDPKNPQDIAEKILLLLSDKLLKNRVEKNGKLRIEKLFSYNTWIEKNINLYNDIIGERN